MHAIAADDLSEKISSPPPSHLPIPTRKVSHKVSHVWTHFSDTSRIRGPDIFLPPWRVARGGDQMILHSRMWKRPGMITNLRRTRTNLLCPSIWRIGSQEGQGPQALL
jgi:hypothetical protein